MEFVTFLDNSPGWAFTALLIFGLLIGSFVNVVAYRLPIMLERQWQSETRDFLGLLRDPRDPGVHRFNLIRPASHCPNCQRGIKPWELVRLISLVLFRGRCAAGGAPITWRYRLSELGGALLSGLLGLLFGFGWQTLAWLSFGYVLVALAAIDQEKQLLPDVLTLPLLWLGLLLNALFPELLGVGASDAILGAAGGYLVLYVFHLGYFLLTGKEGMARGDFKLLAALGAWLGWQALPFIVLFASSIGAAWGLSLIAIHGRSWSQPLAFGPFLAIAGLAVLFVGAERLFVLFS